MDPALIKYASKDPPRTISTWSFSFLMGATTADSIPTDMQVNRHKYFRWTPRTVWLTVAYVVVVPSMFGYMGFVTDVSGIGYFQYLRL